jgi:peptide/nickel transport system permease protein
VANVKPTDETPRADGGTEEPSIFQTTSDLPDRPPRERFEIWVDKHVRAPLEIMWDDIRTRVGATLIIAFVLVGLLPIVQDLVGITVVAEPVVGASESYLSPLNTLKHPLGTDNLGRDLLSMSIHATPAMLKMVIAGGFFSVIVGTLLGTVGGYVGGRVDTVLMSITDIVLVLPGLPLIILLAAVYTPRDPFMVGILLGIDNWPNLSRALRSQVLSIREEPYTEASRIMGIRRVSILRRNIISNLMPYISVNLATSSRKIIFESVALYYLGILPFSTNNWGVMLNKAYQSGDMTQLGQIHWLLVPMTLIASVSLGLILLAQGMDRLFNVRLRAKHVTEEDSEPAPE